ncbi:S8 family serine peptidase [Allobaculum sp. Allo2]|uniref:S8 family serine peptidase n=1 Tax=Allobaculum sp. Allo2 TaxID=2853432 RepID=UPI002112A3A9|nr:S8 family serine peptidase [Allobaculum sp. Allo2]UNT93112.1 S8 family serine peptidase [Allobaculum sp. Allo2]
MRNGNHGGKDWDPADPDIIALREDIRRRQDEHVRQIERQIQNDKPLDILTRLDLSASAVSVEVQTSQIENIQSLDFVRQVTVEQKIYPAEDTQPADLGSAQTGGTNGEVTGINDEALNEESGQGTRIAVLDTGLNASHEVFNNDCFNESLSRKAQQNHMNAADYKASLDLMESSDIEAVMSSLHLQDGDKSSANLNRLYISDKIPFQYNYADGTIDASHALGNIDHGSHVTGIIAANSLIKKGTVLSNLSI